MVSRSSGSNAGMSFNATGMVMLKKPCSFGNSEITEYGNVWYNP